MNESEDGSGLAENGVQMDYHDRIISCAVDGLDAAGFQDGCA